MFLSGVFLLRLRNEFSIILKKFATQHKKKSIFARFSNSPCNYN